MSTWFKFERRWLEVILRAMIPDLANRPGYSAVNFSEFEPLFWSSATPLLRFGVRVATWFVIWTPVFWIQCPRRFDRLPDMDRDRVLIAAANSNIFLARQMLNTLKIVACFAYFREPALRQAFAKPTP